MLTFTNWGLIYYSYLILLSFGSKYFRGLWVNKSKESENNILTLIWMHLMGYLLDDAFESLSTF